MLTLTETARDVVRDMLDGADAMDAGGLRIAAEPSGEGEASLSLSVAEEPAEGDQVVEEDGARVFLEPAAASLLDDQVLDVERHDDHLHFSLGPQQDVESDGGGVSA
jgi:iron-sulfur cluster assembly protein